MNLVKSTEIFVKGTNKIKLLVLKNIFNFKYKNIFIHKQKEQ